MSFDTGLSVTRFIISCCWLQDARSGNYVECSVDGHDCVPYCYYYIRVQNLVILLLLCFVYLRLAAMKKSFQISVPYHADRVLGSCPLYSSILEL